MPWNTAGNIKGPKGDKGDPGNAADIAALIHAATAKTPVDADELPILDSGASWALRKFTWASLKTALQSSFYHRGNILGTVSQSGGVPTGAIIQRGSNANGEFVRFADGTQICSFRMPITQFTTSAPPTGTIVGSWTFPASFVSSPLAFFQLEGSYSSAVNVRPDSSSTTGTTGIYATGVAAGIVVFGPMVCMAIGRWF